MTQRIWSRLLKGLLVSTGFVTTSCYGIPYASYRISYRISGHVTDQQGTPVQDIKISRSYDAAPTATSGNDGTYTVSNRQYDGYEDYDGLYEDLLFHDADGMANGGEFADTVVRVRFKSADRTGAIAGQSYDNYEKSNIDVALKPKK